MIETQVGLEPGLGFIHKSDSLETSYIRITHDQASSIELSGDHMLFLADGQSILAKQVLVGDHLSTPSGVPAVVKEITLTSSKGFIAPLTPSGTININGVVASVYTSPVHHAPQWAAHAAFAPLRLLWSILPEMRIPGSSPVVPVMSYTS